MTTAPVEARTRLFARVKEQLPVRLRPVGVEEAADLARRFTAAPVSGEAVATPAGAGHEPTWERTALGAILQRLEELERKVQSIGIKVGAVDDADGGWIEGETANLSGGGLALRARSAPCEGSQLEIDLALPGDPPTRIRALGRVVYVLPPSGATTPIGPHQLGVEFTAIHEADRETIVRFTFRLQRAQLREGRPVFA